MPERLIRRPEVERLVGLSRSSLYSYISKGDFPPPVKIGVQAVGWPESAIQEWIASRIAASRQNSTCKKPVSR